MYRSMESKQIKYQNFYKITPEKLEEYEKNHVYFTQPQLLALFDYNNGKMSKAERMNYLKVPRPDDYPIDLNTNLETYTVRTPEMRSATIDLALKYEMSSHSTCENIDKTKIFTRRGALVFLMDILENKFIENRIKVSRYNTNLFLVIGDIDETDTQLKPAHTHHLRFTQIMFSDSPSGAPKSSEVCDENVMIIGVHRSTLGKYDIVYSGEVQGIKEDEKITNFDDMNAISGRRFVETKQMWANLKAKKQKYLHIWLQSYLANVKELYIGYKNKYGIIEQPIEHILVKDLPKKCSRKPAFCIGLLYDFLENVENVMSSVNCLNTVIEFEFNQETKWFTYKVFLGKTEKSFISQEYQTFCDNL